jgi:sec-independent protein translocase protein TatB
MIVVPHITPQVELSSLGMADTLILMVLALVVFGPRRLPQIGRQLGKLMYEFRKASNDFKFQMEEELRLAEEADRRKKEEAARAAAAAAPSVAEMPQSEPTAVSSPYPGEGVYPPPVGASSETAAVDEAPKIQPPSTGETVAAKTAEATETKPENAEAVGQNG